MSSRIVTVPNLLTVFRMVLIPVFVSLLFYQRFILALGIFVLAGVTDGLDGLLARRFNQKSQLGTILDPIADKLMLVTSFVEFRFGQLAAGYNNCRASNGLGGLGWIVVGLAYLVAVVAAAVSIGGGVSGRLPWRVEL